MIPEESNIKYREVIVDSIESENKVEDIISNLYEGKFDYLIFRFLEKDLNKMNHLSYLINNYETKFKQQNEGNENNNSNQEENENIINTNSKNQANERKVIFLVHLTRKTMQKSKDKNKKKKNIFSMEEIISNLDDSFDQYFIDNLRSERNDFINILDIKDSTQLLNSIIDFDKFLDKNLNKIISYFDYNLLNKFSKIKLREYTDIILSKLIFDKEKSISKYRY